MYNRLFTKILDSSIWLEPHATRIVWITMLAAMDEDGMTHLASPANIARRAGVTMEECAAALDTLMGPDSNSGDPENQGKRVERIEGGYLVLNAKKYRSLFNREIQREQTRLRVQRFREARKPIIVTQCNADVTNGNDPVTQSEAVTEAETKQKKKQEKKEPFGANVPECLQSIQGFLNPAWAEFLLHRKRNGGALTPYGQSLTLKKLAERPQQAIAALEMTIERGWKSFKWDWFDKESSQPSNTDSNQQKSKWAFDMPE